MRVLCVNVGSSAVRLTTFDGDTRRERHLDGAVGPEAERLRRRRRRAGAGDSRRHPLRLRVVPDDAANSATRDELRSISARTSEVEVFVVPVDEALVMPDEAATQRA